MQFRRWFLMVMVLLVVAGCGGTESAGTPVAAVPPTATLAPTDTPVPTNTPAPTQTPAPTRTPAPTKTATPEPTPTALPEPITIKGSGKKVTDPVYIPFALARVTLAHDGSRNFIVKAYQGDKEQGLTNAIGRYTGNHLLIGEKETFFEVNADGGWLILIEPLGVSSTIGAVGVTGAFDTVSDVFDPVKTGPVPYHFTHTGERNFIVSLDCAGGTDFVQNEIGAVDGEAVVNFKRGPCVWKIQADGEWSIKPRESGGSVPSDDIPLPEDAEPYTKGTLAGADFYLKSLDEINDEALEGYTVVRRDYYFTQESLDALQTRYNTDLARNGWKRDPKSGTISNDIYFSFHNRTNAGTSQFLIVMAVKRDDFGKDGRLLCILLGEK